jgi:hypothetical protein
MTDDMNLSSQRFVAKGPWGLRHRTIKTRKSLTNVLFHSSTIVLLFILVGCGTVTNTTLQTPKNASFGYVEFSIDDTTKWAANGWTVPISETVAGQKVKYGFLGRDVLWAPWGYTKDRRIPLGTGPHSLDLEVLGTVGPAEAQVSTDVVAGKVIPVSISIAWKNPGPGAILYWKVGAPVDPR